MESGSDLDSSKLFSRSSKGQRPRSKVAEYTSLSFDGYERDSKTFDPKPSIPSYKSLPAISATSDFKQEEPDPEDLNKFTRRQLIILMVYPFTEFCTGAVISLQAPFYPAEAEKKGVTASEYGAVFGIFEFTVFLVSFVYGKYMGVIGPKFVYSMGLFSQGVCSILFGLLDRIDGRTLFFAFSMVTRVVEALAGAACLNAAFTIIALEFPKSVATTFATMEMLFAVGLTCGPIIGGALFDLGGYPLPFFFVGGLLILTSLFTYFVLPTPIDSNAHIKDSKGLLQFLTIPAIIVSTLSIFASAISIGHLSATLEPHIREFELDYVFVGLIIVISGATYAVLAPIWGWLCDRKPALDLYMLLGSVFTICGFLLIGPAPFLPFDKTLWILCVGLVFHGIGLGGSLVASFIKCLATAKEHGFPDSVSTYGMVSGLFTSFFSLGNFVGPTISGVLYDAVGFRNGTLFVIVLHALVVIPLAYMIFCAKKGQTRFANSEANPLLGTNKN